MLSSRYVKSAKILEYVAVFATRLVTPPVKEPIIPAKNRIAYNSKKRVLPIRSAWPIASIGPIFLYTINGMPRLNTTAKKIPGIIKNKKPKKIMKPVRIVYPSAGMKSLSASLLASPGRMVVFFTVFTAVTYAIKSIKKYIRPKIRLILKIKTAIVALIAGSLLELPSSIAETNDGPMF